MKKIFTLLFTTAMLSSAFAQYGQKDQRDQRDNDKSNDVYITNDNQGYNKYNNDYDRDDKGYDRHDKGYDRGYDRGYGRGMYVFTAREKNMQIAQIIRVYDYRIQSVKNRFAMSWFQKKHIINNLETQREEEISQVIRKFRSPRNKFGDFGRRNDKHW